MARVRVELSISVDGFVAGPHPTLEEPLGRGGEALHEWAVATATWREEHGRSGGERNVDDDVLRESVALNGAVVMGRRMFSGGDGPWEADPRANGWWGDEPPFGVPVFVATHHPRPPLELGRTTFTFVTEGVERALVLAGEAAGEREVLVAGGAQVAQQALRAGLVDELLLHLAPVLLWGGRRLFEDVTAARLEITGVTQSPAVTHLRYQVPR